MVNISISHEFMSKPADFKILRASGEPAPSLLAPDIHAAAEARRQRPQAALLGVGTEGLPVMLDLADPGPGPLLILADAGAGKTDLLRFVAWEIARSHYPDEVQFCTLTSYSGEWVGYEQLEHCRGILNGSVEANVAWLAGLVGEVRAAPKRPALILLIDDPTMLHPAVLDLLHWLLQTGPAARIWPLVSLNAELAMQTPDWVARFRTRIFGRITRPDLAEEFTPASGAALENLQPSRTGAQFTMRSQGHWVRFRIPS